MEVKAWRRGRSIFQDILCFFFLVSGPLQLGLTPHGMRSSEPPGRPRWRRNFVWPKGNCAMSTLSLQCNSGPGLASESTCLYEHAESLGPCLAVNPLEGAGSSVMSQKYCMDTALTLVIQGLDGPCLKVKHIFSVCWTPYSIM